MRGLYVHVPFCVRKCSYCDFYSLPDRTNLIPAYVDAVLTEARSHADMSFDTLYLGGGTPSLLSAPALSRLLDGLHQVFNLSRLKEASMEVNPESATSELFNAARQGGIDRISIGVQSLTDAELKAVGRIHTADQAVQAVRLARSWFEHISADLIAGLPGQTWPSLHNSIQALQGLGTEHLSIYCLSVEEGTPLASHLPDDLPSDDEQAQLFESVCLILEKTGFIHYEISNFVAAGRECRHNLNYWRGGEYLGLGPGAASHLNGERYRNRPDLESYLSNPGGQVEDREKLKPAQKAAEEAMLRLRLLSEGLDIGALEKKFGAENITDVVGRLEGLASSGQLVADGKNYRLHPSRVLTSNRVLSQVLPDSL